MPRIRRLLRRRRNLWVAAVVVAVYVLALIVWSGHSTHKHSVVATPRDPVLTGIATPSVGADTSAPSAGGSAKSGAGRTPADLSTLLSLPPGNTAIDANSGGAPRRNVRIEIRSDAEVAAFAYAVTRGKPDRYTTTWVKTPVSVNTYGYSTGLVARVLAESGPNATYITCSLFVDGRLHSTKTVRGQWTFTACLG